MLRRQDRPNGGTPGERPTRSARCGWRGLAVTDFYEVTPSRSGKGGRRRSVTGALHHRRPAELSAGGVLGGDNEVGAVAVYRDHRLESGSRL